MTEKLSIIPVLFLVQILFWVKTTQRLRRTGSYEARHAAAIYFTLGLLVVWFAATSYISWHNLYMHPAVLEWMPGLWVPFIPVILVQPLLLLLKSLREALAIAVRETCWSSFAWLQALRIGALGTIVKMYLGTFPVYFGYALGYPDFIYGLSAIPIAMRASKGRLSRKAFVAWNLLGAGLIIIPGELLIQMGLPGPLETFTAEPRIATIFTFPMALAPSFVVPFAVMMNLLVAVVLMLQPDQADEKKSR